MEIKKEKSSYILKGNLEIALGMAIEYRKIEEKGMNSGGYSALVKGWEENLEALKNGKLEIK